MLSRSKSIRPSELTGRDGRRSVCLLRYTFSASLRLPVSGIHRLYQCTVREAARLRLLSLFGKCDEMERRKGDTTRRFGHHCARTYMHADLQVRFYSPTDKLISRNTVNMDTLSTWLPIPAPLHAAARCPRWTDLAAKVRSRRPQRKQNCMTSLTVCNCTPNCS